MEHDITKNDRMRMFFEDLWSKDDPWALETSEFERAKYARQIAHLADKKFERVLEIGCGAGVFTALLTRQADYVMGLDISPTAISLAKHRLGASTIAEFREANVMEEELRDLGSWDLIVMS
jgi:2-polyprenyl-3-methyl-5-hydroxy-6-metoxy-1,4-benzoquinol methylase